MIFFFFQSQVYVPWMGVDNVIFDRMLQDAEYFKSRIDKLDGSNDTGDAVVNAVREKVILVPKQANGAETTGGAKAEAASATNGDSTKPEANVPAPEANGNSKDSNDKAGS